MEKVMKKAIVFVDANSCLDLVKNQKKEILTAMVPWGYSFELRQKFPYLILKREILMGCMRDYKGVKKK